MDTFHGSPDEPMLLGEVERHGGSILGVLMGNLRQCGVDDYVKVVVNRSVEASTRFPDRSIDFCFIDGDHIESTVRADIRAWKPKGRRHSRRG